MKAKAKENISKASIFFTFFVDNLSWAIVFPIFSPLFLDPNNQIFSSDVSIATRTSILGIFLMIFPFAQFFAAPIIGELADRFGRKKMLIFSVFFTFLFFVLSSLSIENNWLYTLLLARFLTGLSSGNLSICLASISDLSQNEKQRIRNFGYLALIAGLAFIVGAYLGGQLSDPTISPLFNYAFPFWAATLLTFLNLIIVIFGFVETAKIDPNVKFDFLQGVHNIQKALHIPNLKKTFLIFFFFLFAWNVLFQFTPILLVRLFDFSSSDIGDFVAIMGLFWAIGAGVIKKPLLKFFSPMKVLRGCFIIFTILCFYIAFTNNTHIIISCIMISVVAAAISWPICNNLLSKKAGPQNQGKILGFSQSMQSLAMTLAPLTALFTHIYLDFPFIIAAISALTAGLIYLLVPE